MRAHLYSYFDTHQYINVGTGARAGASPAPTLLRSSLPIPYRVGAGLVPISANLRMAVILSAAKDLRTAHREILRCAQDDRWWVGRPHGRSLTHLNSNTFRLKFAPLGLAPALVSHCRLIALVSLLIVGLNIVQYNAPITVQTQDSNSKGDTYVGLPGQPQWYRKPGNYC